MNYYYKCVGKTKYKNGCTLPSINKDWFEPRVLKSIVNAVMTEEAIQHIAKVAYDELVSMREAPVVTTDQLKKELADIKKKQALLTDLYLDGQMDKSMLDERNGELVRRKYQIEDELEKRKAVANSDDITQKDVEDYLSNFIKELKETNPTDDEFMRAVFAVFLEKVVVGKEKIAVYVHTPFGRMGSGANGNLSGVSQTLETVKLTKLFSRKKHIHGKNI